MTVLIQWLLGLALTEAAWLATRRVARARGSSVAALAVDAFVPMAAFFLIALATARPVFAGVVVFALIGGLAFADYAKRAVLREPVVFCDMSELIELVRHPHLYLPYAGSIRIIAGALAGVAAVALLIWFEPPVFTWRPLGAAGAVAAMLFLVLAPATVLLKQAGDAMRRFAPSGDPDADARRFGGIATLFIHGIIARSERARRRVDLAPPIAPPGLDQFKGPPVVVVQSESFFDVRRLAKGLFLNLLPDFDNARAGGLSGRMATPAWGANTVRTEFEAITGISGADIGLDRFNPYHAFVRQPVASLAWAMKARGYKTVCLHPYDRRFYARDKVMPHLGFDLFLGQEAFPRPVAGGYVSDAELTLKIAAMIAETPQNLFIFAITMENHGPWQGGLEGLPDPAPTLAAIPEAADLKRFAAKLAGANGMVAQLTKALAKGGVLAFYGDHLPSLPGAFDALNFAEDSTDYFVWKRGKKAVRADLSAHQLPAAVIAALDET